MEQTDGDGLLFPSEKGKQYLLTNWNRPFRVCCGIDEAITLYACRHTYVTRSLKRGVPIAVVARLVGNSVRTLLAHYAHLDQGQAENLYDMVELATA